MKQAKQYPFLRLQQQRLKLWFEPRTDAADTPGETDFFRWSWQALKPFHRRADISIVLCDEAEARAFNRDYRGKDYATNVLSFALNEAEWLPETQAEHLQGDLVLCADVVAREAAEQGKDLHAHYAHLCVHGVLHLMGFDHTDEAAAESMETLEINILHQLGYANPYTEYTP